MRTDQNKHTKSITLY